MISVRAKKAVLALIVIAVFAGIAVSSVALNGVPYGNDLTQHYQFAAAVSESLSRGEVYPSLVPEANNGLGDYGLRFYPPFGYYVLAVGYKMAGSWFGASVLAFFFLYFTGGLGVYLWIREDFSDKQALIAAALYTFAPYHLNQIYNNFLYGEFAASAVIPFCFLFLHRTIKSPGPANAACLAASYGLLILTHLPSLIFCSIAFAVYGTVLMIRSGPAVRMLAWLGGAVGTAIAATSVYWIKPLTELGWINHSKQEYFSEIYSYANNFLLRPSNFLNMQDDVLAIWMGDLMLAVTLLIAAPSLVLLLKRGKKFEPLLYASMVTMLVAVFFSSVLSKPVWDVAGFIQKIQFPWRWLGVVSVTGAAFASYGITAASERTRSDLGAAVTSLLGIGVLVFTVSSVFISKQSVFIGPDEFSDEKISATLNGPSRDCWWTVWAADGFYRNDPRVVSSASRRAVTGRWDTLEREIQLTKGTEEEVVLPILYYPHWRVFADGKRIESRYAESGLLAATIPGDTENVVLKFREPDTVRSAAVISAVGVALIAFGFLIPFTKRTFLGNSGNSPEKGGHTAE